jgi:integrase
MDLYKCSTMARESVERLLITAERNSCEARVVMEILGHSQIGVTMNVYTHVVQNTQREALATMDRLLKQPR